ncbi:ABC transporter ATP-binding protein [Cohnella sp. WQ 127256]|uniref:ABC transporter ATP-binding protein n=1 Tax=Cohnella sp. WQ 127256 TaxID=2938790 RepID=UPI002119A061|nr:ABC transporter ATP-binding protein [Cohnella sp. WQ 127256]
MSHSVTFRNLTKKYGENTAVNGIDFSIKEGEFFTILGPSGCGKTTLLRMIAGFNSIENGEICFDDRVINDIPAYKRNIGMVFQNYAIFPHMTIQKNVAYGLKARRLSKQIIAERVDEILQMMHIKQYKDRDPSQLSGGQQQRVALARALVIHPTILLMDEPLSNLDAKLRIEMRIAIMKIQKEMNITTIYVTHDQEEALSMSDRIAVMNSGVIEQIGTPKEIYSKPATAFVAGFIGTSNFLEGEISEGAMNGCTISIEGTLKLELALNKPVIGKVDIAIRPEDIYIEQPQERGMNGTISLVTFLGDYISYEVQLDNGKLLEVNEYSKDTDQLRTIGDRIGLRLSADKINVYDQETKEAIR